MISACSLSSCPQTPTPLTMLKPGVSVGTMMLVSRSRAPVDESSLVRQTTIAKAALGAPDVNHLCPLITHSSPSRTAMVLIAYGLDPGWSGSVIEKQEEISPRTSG